MKTRLIYIVQTGDWCDSGQAMIEALPALAECFDLVVFTQPLAMAQCRDGLDIQRRTFITPIELLIKLFDELVGHSEAVLVCCGGFRAMAIALLARMTGTRLIQLQEGPCGSEGWVARLHQRLLNRMPVLQLASSEGDALRLQAKGVQSHRIRVVDPSLPHWLPSLPVKVAHARSVRRVMLNSVFDGTDGLELLLQALSIHTRLNQIEFHVYGTGHGYEQMRHQAAAQGLNVVFMGCAPRVMQFMSFYDAWLQTGGTPCDMSTLSAMAVGLPVIVPHALNAPGFFESGVSALCFSANDVDDLGRALRELPTWSLQARNRIAVEGRQRALQRFGPAAIVQNYHHAVQQAEQLLRSHEAVRCCDAA